MEEAVSRERLVEELTRLLKKYHAEAAYLFGSYAREEARGDSDIDVLIVGGSAFDPSDIFAIAEELYRAFDKNVDVYELSEIDEGTPFHRSIMRDRVLAA